MKKIILFIILIFTALIVFNILERDFVFAISCSCPEECPSGAIPYGTNCTPLGENCGNTQACCKFGPDIGAGRCVPLNYFCWRCDSGGGTCAKGLDSSCPPNCQNLGSCVGIFTPQKCQAFCQCPSPRCCTDSEGNQYSYKNVRPLGGDWSCAQWGDPGCSTDLANIEWCEYGCNENGECNPPPTLPPPCSAYTTKDSCEAAGCNWCYVNGEWVCQSEVCCANSGEACDGKPCCPGLACSGGTCVTCVQNPGLCDPCLNLANGASCDCPEECSGGVCSGGVCSSTIVLPPPTLTNCDFYSGPTISGTNCCADPGPVNYTLTETCKVQVLGTTNANSDNIRVWVLANWHSGESIYINRTDTGCRISNYDASAGCITSWPQIDSCTRPFVLTNDKLKPGTYQAITVLDTVSGKPCSISLSNSAEVCVKKIACADCSNTSSANYCTFCDYCRDGIQNCDETGVDCGGSCVSGTETTVQFQQVFEYEQPLGLSNTQFWTEPWFQCCDGIDNDHDCLVDLDDTADCSGVTCPGNKPPQAEFSCDSSQCSGGDGPNCIMYQPTSDINTCIFTLRNNSTDTDGQISLTKWYIKKQTEPDTNYREIGSCSGKCDHTIQKTDVPDPAIYTVKLYVKDDKGLSASTTRNLTVKKEISADFMCSLDNSNWVPCENIKLFQGQVIFVKDDPSLPRHSEASEGATINSRTWQKGNGTTFETFAQNTNNASTTLTTDKKFIRLIVADTASRSDRQDYRLSVTYPLPFWKEIPPVIFFRKMLIAFVQFFNNYFK